MHRNLTNDNALFLTATSLYMWYRLPLCSSNEKQYLLSVQVNSWCSSHFFACLYGIQVDTSKTQDIKSCFQVGTGSNMYDVGPTSNRYWFKISWLLRKLQNVGLILVQRRKRWPNIKPTLVQCLMFAGMCMYTCACILMDEWMNGVVSTVVHM